MALNDIYKLTLSGETLGEDNDNVYYYRTEAVGAGVGSTALVTAFERDIMPEILALVSESATYQLIEAVNLATPIDFAGVTPNPAVGELDSAAGVNDMPSFLVASIQFNRNGPGTRYSWKRFSGLLKAHTFGNDLSGGVSAQWIAAGNVMCNALIDGSWTFRPVQVKHPTPLGVNPVVNFSMTNIITADLGTQNTRKD